MNYYQPSVVQLAPYLHTVQQPVSPIQSVSHQLPSEIIVHLVHKKQEFSSSICDCCEDIQKCLHGCLCPCWMFGKNVEMISGGRVSCCEACMKYCCCCGPLSHSAHRRKLRLKYDLDAEPCNDFCVVCLCPCCALCQEAREIEYQVTKPPKRQTMN
jgi:Cys-rich protein (TIGR01571 family)